MRMEPGAEPKAEPQEFCPTFFCMTFSFRRLFRSLTHKANQRPAHELVPLLTLDLVNFGEQFFGALQVAFLTVGLRELVERRSLLRVEFESLFELCDRAVDFVAAKEQFA